jgi:hypothetical protein
MCKKAQDFVADHTEPITESYSTNFHGRATAETVSRQHLTADIWVHSQTTLLGMCGGHSGTAIFFFLQVLRFPSFSIILLKLHIHPMPMPFNLIVESVVK